MGTGKEMTFGLKTRELRKSNPKVGEVTFGEKFEAFGKTTRGLKKGNRGKTPRQNMKKM